MIPAAARIALVVAALACAAWLREGHYAIGLDFEGGARVVLRPHGDPQQVLLHALRSRPDAKIQSMGDRIALDFEGGDADDVHALEHDLASEADIDWSSVIPAAWPHWLGRPVATLVAFAAALCWAGMFARPRWWPLAIVGTLLLAWTLAVIDRLAIGGTLSMPLELSGIVLGIAAAPAARPGSGDPFARLRAAWPAAIALLVVLVAATAVVTLLPTPAPSASWVAMYGYHALKLARHATIVVATVAALASIASSAIRPSSRS